MSPLTHAGMFCKRSILPLVARPIEPGLLPVTDER